MSSFCRLYLGNIKATWKLRKWTPLESPKTNSLPGHYHKLRQQKSVQWVILLCRNLQIMKLTPHPIFTLTLVGQPRRQADYVQEYNTMICAGRLSGPKQSLSCRKNPPSCSKHRNKQYLQYTFFDTFTINIYQPTLPWAWYSTNGNKRIWVNSSWHGSKQYTSYIIIYPSLSLPNLPLTKTPPHNKP